MGTVMIKTIVIYLLILFPAIGQCVDAPGKDLLSAKSFTSKQVVINNFRGKLVITSQPGSYIGIKLNADKDDVSGIHISYDKDLLTFEGDDNSYPYMEMYLSPSTPLEINMSYGVLLIEDRESNTHLNLKETASIEKVKGNIFCNMRGISKLDVQSLDGDGFFELEDTSVVNVQYGFIDNLDVSVHDSAVFTFSGRVNKNFIYSAQNVGKIFVQSVGGNIQKKGYSRNAGVFINSVLQED